MSGDFETVRENLRSPYTTVQPGYAALDRIEARIAELEEAGPVCVDCLRNRTSTGTRYFREEEVEARIAELEAKVERLRAGIIELRMRPLHREVERLERDNAVVRESNVTMNNEAARLRAENERIQGELRDADRHIVTLNEENERLRARPRDYDEYRRLKQEVERLRGAIETYLNHRHRQHEWRCDSSECKALSGLIEVLEGAESE